MPILAIPNFSQQTTYDIAIVNGIVYDGIKSSPKRINIGISDEKIIYIGTDNINASTKINANGYIVAPGFIDMQTHSDHTMPLRNRNYAMYLAQGVTTIVTGNCGQSPVDTKAFVKSVGNTADVNYVLFTGYNSLKTKFQKNQTAMATAEEFQNMCNALRENLENGAAGLSLGLA